MTVVYDRFGVQVRQGDCLDVLRTMPDSSVHAIVTDPPYGLSEMPTKRVVAALSAWLSGDREHVPDGRGFMGREWDAFVPPPAVWDECLRVLTPGGHLLAFAGTRTADLMGLSIRLAGFEIRDSVDFIGSRISWMYGQGMPKSLDVSKAIDRMAGAERIESVGTGWHRSTPGGEGVTIGRFNEHYQRGDAAVGTPILAPATDAARQWDGWGTGLRPSHEPIVVARKPLTGTVAASVLEHGTGGLNVGATKVPHGPEVDLGQVERHHHVADNGWRVGKSLVGSEVPLYKPDGRWPPNTVLSHVPLLDAAGEVIGDACADGCVDGCPVAELDRQSGELHTQDPATRRHKNAPVRMGVTRMLRGNDVGYADTGGASRFFPCFRFEAKAPTAERPRVNGQSHSTVKPVDLMRWLCRLVTPPGGTICDPFAGTGTTGQAARAEGFLAVLIENDPDSIPYIVARLDAKPRTEAPKPGAVAADPEGDLFDLLDGAP